MKVEELLDLYSHSFSSEGSKKQYFPKAKQLLKKYESQLIEDVINTNNIRAYILDPTHSPEKKRVAIQNLWNFIIESNYLELGDFPVLKEETASFVSSGKYISKKNEIQILDYKFNIEELVNLAYYTHLEEENAIKTARAVIALCLGTGFDIKELFDFKEYRLKFDDVIVVNESTVLVKHKNYNVTFEISDLFGEILYDYVIMRKDYMDEDFFIKTWDGYSLKVNKNYCKKKPYDIQGLVYYILYYICAMNDVDKLSITDLRANMVYRSLIKNQGSSLVEIIKTYGYTTFVDIAFRKYCIDFLESEEYSLPFFNLSSSEDETCDEDKKSFDVELKRYLRDRRIVEKLKELYDYKCQVCGETLEILNNVKYIEAHHIIPLGEGCSSQAKL